MFHYLYNAVNHHMLHVWDVFCIALILIMAVIAGVHVYKQKRREDDFADEQEEAAKE